MTIRRALVLLGVTLAFTALVFAAGLAYLYRTDGRPRACPAPVAADLPQRAPHLSTPAPC